ncbi:hypothetical protein tinsulaeT_16230 [Thalassotalea insulae]|uniref:C2H2-type domain-containing protein n=2 Tax=Thalassotalea insulae TaxID=2056778 RepID=A0ABQ6GQP0_9GAMM|nr:hypothetical protein tinsulaeT_16230 [Thalassotalea insulae]
MEVSNINEKFESYDSHKIWEATWEILRCDDIDKLTELSAFIPRFSDILKQVDMGGAVRKNEDDTKLAFEYIKKRCSGLCRCFLYTYSGHNMFNPKKESDLAFVDIDKATIIKEVQEQHFSVTCSTCSKKYKVREVHGWHVPWYEWSSS